MKSVRTSRIGLIALFMATSLFVAENGVAQMASFEKFSVSTKNFTLNFDVGGDGRLYQRAVGAVNVNKKLQRTDECYPQAGDGYIWEPALQVVHVDGNTSTTLIYDSVTRTNDDAG